MNRPLTHDCQLELTYRNSATQRPFVYDFLWDHLPALYSHLKEKKVAMTLTSLSTPKKVQHWTEKFLRDKRFNHRARTQTTKKETTLHAEIPTRELENVLSAYNVLVGEHFTQLTFESPHLRADFSRAPDNVIVLQTNQKHAKKIQSFLSREMTPAPSVRTLTFPSSRMLQRALTPRGGKS